MAEPSPSPGAPATDAATTNADGAAPRAWGPWASAGWLVVLLAPALSVRGALLAAGGRPGLRVGDLPRALAGAGDLAELAASGRFAGLGVLIGAPVVLAGVGLLARARGWPAIAYVGLRPPGLRGLMVAVAGFVAGLLGSDVLTLALGRTLAPPTLMALALGSPPWLVALAVVVAAPLVEEVLFRGFLYRGLAESPRLGPGMAIGLTALAWATSHGADDLYGLATTYLIGLYLGLVRHLTRSTATTFLLRAAAGGAVLAAGLSQG